MAEQIPDIAVKKLDALFDAFAAVADGTYVYLCDMTCDYSRWSKAAVDTFGLPAEYLEHAESIWEEHIHPDDREVYKKTIQRFFEEKNEKKFDMQYRASNKSGEYVLCTCRGAIIAGENGTPKYFAGTIRNQGMYGNLDAMTGLRNQYGFFEDLKNAIERNQPVTLCMLGIGQFTEINEIYGYHFGNLVLQKFGRHLLTTTGSKGCVYRLDGTKFAILSYVMSANEIKELYEKVRQHFQHGQTIDGKFLILQLNAGLLTLDDFSITDQTVYSCLNFAYGESKVRRQGELIEFYNNLTKENRDRLKRLQVIRNSIVQDYSGFYLLYQPVVDAHNEKLIGAEALIRWKNDKYGVVPPDHFIPILERDPLFIQLGKWILTQAMQDAIGVLDTFPEFLLSVNLSYAQIERPDFVNMVQEILAQTGFPPKNLCLEITERCKLLDLRLLRNVIINLRAMGIRFALDDFGTGFSSMGIAKNLTFDTIKIDRSFVENIEEDGMERELIGHFTSFAAIFGANVCVEGIETMAMRDILQKYSVSSFQGYYYSKPIPLEDFMASELFVK